jgi:hypothetical protein
LQISSHNATFEDPQKILKRFGSGILPERFLSGDAFTG